MLLQPSKGLKQISEHKTVNHLSNDTISMNMLYTKKMGEKGEKGHYRHLVKRFSDYFSGLLRH